MTRRKDGLWQEAVTIQGKRRYFYGKTKSEVNKKIAAYQEETEKGALFDVVADEWWEQHEPTLAYNTTKQYKPALGRVKTYFAGKYIRTIKPSDVNIFVRSFVHETHAADKTARTQLMVCNLIFKYAVANGYLENNVARDLTVPKGLKKASRSVPSEADIAKIKQSLDAPFGAFAYWLLYTGLRKGELLALTWEDVDMDEHTIVVRKSLYHENNKAKLKKPKTSAGMRVVPILNKLYSTIKPKKSGIVFPGKNGYMTEMEYQRNWSAYVAETGVTCTAHQLRHAYATMLFENDIAVKDAQRLLGHAQASTTQDVYTDIRKAREKLINRKLLDADVM